ncbi:MAG: transcriptional regulator PpsR, partial [Alphaproteobacteria bacterium]|nr:transcriptional regulator PpsR [Alphaproteobacteria bacterium]
LRGMYGQGPDSIVFAGADGDILSANDSFLNLIGAAHDVSVRGQPLPDMLQRGSVDFKVMTESASQTGRLRAYATKIAGDYGSPRDIEIAVTRFQAGQAPVFAFVIREVGAVDGPRGEPRDDGLGSVKELVGSSTLKDIVSETTNVVEKMCIETAIALTMNNRVAAAEMLGLSRQSLYVKLRKFGLIDRDTND